MRVALISSITVENLENKMNLGRINWILPVMYSLRPGVYVETLGIR